MEDILLKLLTFAYAGVAITGLLAYLPTLKELYFDKNSSVNIKTYATWSFGGAVATLYCIFILHDLLLLLFTIGETTFCITALLLAIRNKRFRKKEKNKI